MECAEIYQQAETTATQAQLGEHLLGVKRREPFNGLQLHDHLVSDEQVRAESLSKNQIPNADGYWQLASHRNTALSQFIGQHHLVDRLQQPWPELCVDAERCSQHYLRDIVLILHRS